MMSENENFDGPRWYSTNFEKPCMLKWLKCLKCLSQVLNSHQNWLSKVPWIWLDFNHWKQGRAEYGCIMVITGLRTLRSVCLGEMTIPLVQLKKERMTSPCKVLLVVARIIAHIILVISCYFPMGLVRNSYHISACCSLAVRVKNFNRNKRNEIWYLKISNVQPSSPFQCNRGAALTNKLETNIWENRNKSCFNIKLKTHHKTRK